MVKVLNQEISWASHLGITACILPTPAESSPYYAQTVLTLLNKIHLLRLWVQVPIIPLEVDFAMREQSAAAGTKEETKTSAPTQNVIPGMTTTALSSATTSSSPSSKASTPAKAKTAEALQVSAENASKSWERWNRFRLQCQHHHKLGLVLELTEHMPSTQEMDRWFGEPLKAIILPTRLFITNSKGAPVLSAAHVAFLHKAFYHNVQIVISGSPVHGNPANRGIYQQYVTHIFSKTPALSKADQFCQSFWDYLQDPLQPLMDNLESATYEVFERDPVKYQQYEDAIYKAVLDISVKKKETLAKFAEINAKESATAESKTAGSDANAEKNSNAASASSTTPAAPSSKASAATAPKNANGWQTQQLVVMIVGAGRGPIVEAAMRAEQRAKIPIKLYALDKNPNALVTLRSKQLVHDRWKTVTIVHQDMREWHAPEYADILVSEMLGSFGDNELSPECLQGAERLIEPNHGVSIPQWYTSYLAPMSSCKLWNELSIQHDATKSFETSYVVKLHDFFELGKPQEVFNFVHPSPPPYNNDRSITLEFEAPTSTLIHGFSGYFDCCLYKDVHISIAPQNHTTDMVSWFPIWFPIRTPMTVKRGDKITIHMWRHNGNGKVWYEWSISTPVSTSIHNTAGRSHAIGL